MQYQNSFPWFPSPAHKDKGWPSASQHKRPQKPGHASALSSDFQPTERACNIVYAEKAVEETNEFLIKIEEYKRPNLQYSCREPRPPLLLSEPFVLGIQYHPENMTNKADSTYTIPVKAG
ncbi:uncharacterized protein LOC122200052 isoform X4 [Panthera leo]|uniref:uncharacterized protein LOC122200052 isoform X4 n=1 Tax=Panthera leo TaxID=9689 RepID=UPI001C69AA8F|nr:uncharacterized protein LOC122200052 isoform X4 [Panthera leo]